MSQEKEIKKTSNKILLELMDLRKDWIKEDNPNIKSTLDDIEIVNNNQNIVVEDFDYCSVTQYVSHRIVESNSYNIFVRENNSIDNQFLDFEHAIKNIEGYFNEKAVGLAKEIFSNDFDKMFPHFNPVTANKFWQSFYFINRIQLLVYQVLNDRPYLNIHDKKTHFDDLLSKAHSNDVKIFQGLYYGNKYISALLLKNYN